MASNNPLETILETLVASLELALHTLKGDAHARLIETLHNHDTIPDKKVASLSSRAINLLHETEQLLEPRSLVLADHFLGYLSSKCLTAAVELNIPDLLRDGPKSLSHLAAESRAHPHRLRQVLRVLYNNGIFSYEPSAETYSNNSTSELLLSDHWTQWRNWVELYGNEFYEMAQGIPAACRQVSTRMPAQIVFNTDKDMFTYFQERGWVPRLHKTLSGGAAAQAPGILADYPWEQISGSTFLDVGGGGGGLVALVLREHKDIRSGILDRLEIIAQNIESFHGQSGQFRDIGDRVPPENLIAGDFLKEVPAFEVYTMKWCLHDWDDSKALKVMANIRKAILTGPKSRLVIFESLLEDGRMGRLSRYGDIIMWMSANGQERTETQWRSLAKQTGWKVKEIYTLRNAWPCAIDLVPDWDSHLVQAQQNAIESLALNHGSTNKSNRYDRESSEVIPGSIPLTGTKYLTTMTFLEPWDAKKGNPFIRIQPHEGFEYMNFKWQDYKTEVTDARPNRDIFNIDTHGFAYFDDPIQLSSTLIEKLRANDKATIRDKYYDHIEKFMKWKTGAARVIIFDDTVRKRNPLLGPKENPNGREQPATMVHCDQSESGAFIRLQRSLGAEEDINEILKGRVQLVNVWRPLNGPVNDWPLATLDSHSLSSSDIYTCDLLKNQHEKRGETVTLCHNDAQQWYYLDSHRTDEVTLIKIWDSKKDVDAKLCAHTAFKHPNTLEFAEPRESIEVRCFLIY